MRPALDPVFAVLPIVLLPHASALRLKVSDIGRKALAGFSRRVVAVQSSCAWRDTRAAIAWIGYIWLVPLIGNLLFFLLGISRGFKLVLVFSDSR